MRWCLVAVAFSVPIQQLVLLPGLGPVTNAVIPLAVLGAAIAALRGAPIRRVPATVGWVLVFVAWVGLSTYWSVAPQATAARFLTFVQLLVLVCLACFFLRTQDDRRRFIQGFVFGSLLVVGSLLVNFVSGQQANANSIYGRFASGLANPNRTAAVILLGMVSAWYLLVRSRRWRTVNTVALVLSPLAVLLTASRMGFLAASVFAIVVVGWMARSRGRAQAGVLVAFGIAVVLVLTVAPPASIQRVLEFDEGQPGAGSIAVRTTALEDGLEAFAEEPIVGSGGGTFARRTSEGSAFVVAHNTYLSVAVELGLVGLVLLAGAFATALGALRRCDTLERWYGLLLFAVWGVIAAFTSFEDDKLTWLVLILLATAATSGPAREGDTAPMPAVQVPTAR